MALISVIIPAYNASATVRECLDSVLTQGRMDLEAIVVDDGSSDDTARIVRTLAASDSRIRLICQRNQRQAAARNIGISHSTGKYIALLDADDIALPGRLQKQVGFLDANPLVTVLGGWRINVDINTGAVLGMSTHPADHETLCRNIYRNCPFSTSTVVARAHYFRNWQFDPAMPPCEDHDLWLRTYRVPGVRFHNLQEPLVRYRCKRYMTWSHYAKISLIYRRALKAEGKWPLRFLDAVRPYIGALRRNPLNRKY